MKTSESVKEIIPAFAKMQAELKGAEADSINPRFKSKYFSIEAIWEAIKEPLTKNKLVLVQNVESESGSISVTTTVYHTSGEYISFGPLRLFCDRPTDPQCYGANITYAKKYSISSALGLVREPDDDGNSAVPKQTPRQNMDAQSILALEQELAGHEELKTTILDKFKVENLESLDQRYFAQILKRIRQIKESNENN